MRKILGLRQFVAMLKGKVFCPCLSEWLNTYCKTRSNTIQTQTNPTPTATFWQRHWSKLIALVFWLALLGSYFWYTRQNDLTLADSTGQELAMGTPYDFFGPEAHPSYRALPDSVLANRALLREAMIRHGFRPIRTEWWHFSFSGKNYELSDMLWKCY